jgi:serine protein kinase
MAKAKTETENDVLGMVHPRSKLRKKCFDQKRYQALNWEGTWDDYLDLIYSKPKTIRTSFQMIYDMIMSHGFEMREYQKKMIPHYFFFDKSDPPIRGLEPQKAALVKFIKGAAGHYGSERRVCLLHGPVGSAKSTIARAIKRGLEDYSASDEGFWATIKWVNMPVEDGTSIQTEELCPMHEEPLKLVPVAERKEYLAEINERLVDNTPECERTGQYDMRCVGNLCPCCKTYMNVLLKKYNGDWDKVVDKHIRVVRMTHSESDRIGIGTFQPKDEKNQDSTELTGDINYRKIAHFGKDSDARAFNFDGELNIANRGIVEFIEVLKLDVAFLYDLLGASQEKSIKPKKFSQIDVDEFILGHTNSAEYKRLQNNEFMEALRDRTSKIDIPYNTRWKDENDVVKDQFSKVKQHVAPHTFETGSFWCILTRLEDDIGGKISLIQKAELYNGFYIPGYNEEAVIEMRMKHPEEGLSVGISCRYLIDKISNCLSEHHDYINAFMVMHEVKEGLKNYPLITDKNLIARYLTCVEYALEKYEKTITNEVQRAMVGDEDLIARLCGQYIDNVRASNQKSKIRNQVTGEMEKPNERLMREIERKINIPDGGANDFRREISSFIGDLAMENKTFRWDSNQQLKEALEAKLFDDIKDTIRLSAMSDAAMVVDADQQAKLDSLKARMIKWYGYNAQSATDILNHVASIFARGGSGKKDS